MSDQEILSFSALEDSLIKGFIGVIIFNDVQQNLVDHEDTGEATKIQEEIDALVLKNHKLGGSEHGYFYNNELFAVGSSINLGSIANIDSSLTEEAYYIKANKDELAQDMVYVGNFLSVLCGMINKPSDTKTRTANLLYIFLANLPPNLLSSLIRHSLQCMKLIT